MFRGFLGSLRQLADLTRHYGKSSSHLAGSCRLYGRIDGQKVRLVGNIQNRRCHAVDLRQAVQILQRSPHGILRRHKLFTRILQRCIRTLPHLLRIFHDIITEFGTAAQAVRHIADTAAHIDDLAVDTLDRIINMIEAGGKLLCRTHIVGHALHQFRGRSPQGDRFLIQLRTAHPKRTQNMIQRLDHLIGSRSHLAQVIVSVRILVHFSPVSDITVCNLEQRTCDRRQRLHKARNYKVRQYHQKSKPADAKRQKLESCHIGGGKNLIRAVRQQKNPASVCKIMIRRNAVFPGIRIFHIFRCLTAALFYLTDDIEDILLVRLGTELCIILMENIFPGLRIDQIVTRIVKSGCRQIVQLFPQSGNKDSRTHQTDGVACFIQTGTIHGYNLFSACR